MRRTRLAAILLQSTGLVLLFWALGWAPNAPGQVSLQVTGIRPVATNVLQVSAAFTNPTSHPLNIVDAVDGHPAYHIGPDPKLGISYGFVLARLANSLRFNLAAGASLTDTFWITNPPPRFRISVPLRDPAAEHSTYSTIRSNLVSSRLGQVLEDMEVIGAPEPDPNFRLSARSGWVESGLPYLPVPRPSYTNWFRLTGHGVIGIPDHVPDFMFGGAVNPGCKDPAERAGHWTVSDNLNKLIFTTTNIVVVQCGHLRGSPVGPRPRKPPLNFLDFSGTGALQGFIGNPANFGLVFFTARAVTLGRQGKPGDQFYLRVYDSGRRTLLVISATPATPEVISPVPIRDSDFHISDCEH